MSGYLTILLGIILVNNYVLAQFLGICPFLGVSKETRLCRRHGRSRNIRNGIGYSRNMADHAGFERSEHSLFTDYRVYTHHSCSGAVC